MIDKTVIEKTMFEQAVTDSPDSLHAADELILVLARVIVIGVAAVYYNELAGLLILLGVALSMLRLRS